MCRVIEPTPGGDKSANPLDSSITYRYFITVLIYKNYR